MSHFVEYYFYMHFNGTQNRMPNLLSFARSIKRIWSQSLEAKERKGKKKKKDEERMEKEEKPKWCLSWKQLSGNSNNKTILEIKKYNPLLHSESRSFYYCVMCEVLPASC